eukprot:gene9431-9511_t
MDIGRAPHAARSAVDHFRFAQRNARRCSRLNLAANQKKAATTYDLLIF